MASFDGPQIVINYSPELDLRIRCVSACHYRDAGGEEYRFEVKCRLRHPSGSFEYSCADLCFDINSFARFEQELRNVQQGAGDQAALKNVGERFVLRLTGNSRELQAELAIREYIAPRLATLTATIDVDYDLFVNKLVGEVGRFVAELRDVEPEDVGEEPQS